MPVLITLIVVLLLLSVPSQASEQWPTEMPSSSKKAAIRRKTYIGALRCIPNKFEWHGKHYTIVEVWLERVKREKLSYVCVRIDSEPEETFGFTCLDCKFLNEQTPDFWAIRNWISRHFVYSLYVPEKGIAGLLEGASMKIAPYGERGRSADKSQDAAQITLEYCPAP